MTEEAEALRAALAEVAGERVAVAIAIVDGDERAVRTSGPDSEAGLYEIGSITKTVTATLLASLAEEGVVALDDRVDAWLAAGPNGEITLGQLATHTSGLPRLAPNWGDARGFDMADPYAGYTPAMVEEGLRAVERTQVGEVAYSNFGYQLLGLVLERAAGEPYEDAVRRRVLDPLGMSRTRERTAGSARLQGYSSGRPVPAWGGHLPGPGGLLSTIDDMATYLASALHPPSGPVGDAMRMAMEARVDTGAGTRVGLGWHIDVKGRHWHNGGTGGFRSMLLADTDRSRGAVALVASADMEMVDVVVRRSVEGGDPAEAVPEPVEDPAVVARALELMALVGSREWEGLRAAMVPSSREVLTVERLDAGWQQIMGSRGMFIEAGVSGTSRTRGLFAVELAVRHADGEGGATLWLDPDLMLTGIIIR